MGFFPLQRSIRLIILHSILAISGLGHQKMGSELTATFCRITIDTETIINVMHQ